MNRIPLRLWVLGGITTFCAAAAPPATQPTGVPRYRLTVGQELTFTRSSKTEPAREGRGEDGTTSFWVVGRTADGAGWHVVAREGSGVEAEPQVSAFDLWPDGRQAGGTSRGMPAGPVGEFPLLPPSPDAHAWQAATPDGVRVYHPAPATRPATVQFTAETRSDMYKIYQVDASETDTFDAARGLATHAEGQMSQGYGFHSKQTWSWDLTGDAMHPADETARYGADVATTLAAIDGYRIAMTAADKAADPAPAAAAALAQLKAAQPKVTNPTLSTLLTKATGSHGEFLRYMADEKKARDAMVGHPAPPFDLIDLDGKRHALADLRGQVVVLDFWYRGCGWCMRAMPQVKQLAHEYQGRPVAIFGMNNDPDAKDAKFVADLFALPYPTLLMATAQKPTSRPSGPPVDYHVQGYPTTFVIGPDGVVREMDVGYSPTLHDDLKRAIDPLLPDGPRAAAGQ